MHGSQFREDLDTRPFPLFIQGIITGVAVALVIVAFFTYRIDHADGALTDGTEILVFLAAIAGPTALWAFIPITRQEARERHTKRVARARRAARPAIRINPAPQGAQLRLVSSRPHNHPRRPAAG